MKTVNIYNKIKRLPKKVMIPSASILLVGVFGIVLSTSSYAATKVYTGVEVKEMDSRVMAANPGITTANVFIDNMSDNQTVAVLNQGQTVNLSATNGGGGWYDVSTCYLLQAPNSTAKATITDESSSKNVTVVSQFPYKSFCVKASAPNAGQASNVTVTDTSSNQLYVYMAMVNQKCTDNC